MGSVEMEDAGAEAGAWLEIGSAGCGFGVGEGVGATTWVGEGMDSTAWGVGFGVAERTGAGVD